MAYGETDRCVLCLGTKRSPVHIKCGHSFCSECLKEQQSYDQHPWSNRCPLCRSSVDYRYTMAHVFYFMIFFAITTFAIAVVYDGELVKFICKVYNITEKFISNQIDEIAELLLE